jgi:hypothetical protein
MVIGSVIALISGWTGVDLSTYTHEKIFSLMKDYSIWLVGDRYSKTVPGTNNLSGSKYIRISEYPILGGTVIKVDCQYRLAGAN